MCAVNEDDDDPDQTSHILLSMGLWFLGCCCCIGKISKNDKKHMLKIQVFLEQQNMNVWHSKGLHWSIGPKCRYLQIMMNYDPNLGRQTAQNTGIQQFQPVILVPQ